MDHNICPNVACRPLLEVPWSCYDYLTIASWGEDFVSLKILDGFWDKCNSSHFVGTIRGLHTLWEYDRESNTGYYSVSDFERFKVVHAKDDKSCFTVNLRKVDQCLGCVLREHSTPVHVRTARHTRSEKRRRKLMHRALESCHVPNV